MVSTSLILKTIVVNTVFAALALGQYHLLSEAFLEYGFGAILVAIICGVTLLKNYLVLGMVMFYGFFFEWNNAERRQKPIEEFFGEFHVYTWSTALIESLTVVGLTLIFPFSFSPVNFQDYVLFFPIMFLFEVVFDFFHYWAHRISHLGALYKNFHKIHHRHKYPTAITTFYQDPVDLIISNSIPTTIAFGIVMVMLGIPISFFQLSLISSWKTVIEIAGHLGKRLAPASSFPQFVWLAKWLGWELYIEDHDLHHSNFNCNYSKRFGLWDRVFGTYVKPKSLS